MPEVPNMAGQRPTANWYPDPNNDALWRYWDGVAWTDQYAPRAAPPLSSEVAVAARPTVAAQDPAVVSHKRPRAPTLQELVAGARLESPRHPLDEQVEVVGETYHVKGIKEVFRAANRAIPPSGATLEEIQCILAPEPWNPYDSNAVAVMIGVHQVGHLRAELAHDYARPLGDLARQGVLTTGIARIWAKDDSGVVRARVTILIPESDSF